MPQNLRMKPLLVTGLPGVPGWNLFHWFQKNWGGEVVGIRPPANLKADVPGSVALDAKDGHLLAELFETYKFGAVVDASGNCALKACECDTALSDLLNCHFGVEVARQARRLGVPLVRLSSDLVFSGDDSHKGPYFETEIPDPVSAYGKSMALAERMIQEVKPDCHILRIPLPMGMTPGGHAGAIDWIEWRFRNNRPATLYFDERRSPIHKDDLAEVVNWILLHPEVPTGIYHCGGPRTLSLYEIAQIINVAGNYPPGLLQGCQRVEAGPLPPRAGDVSVNSDKLLAHLPAGMIRPWPLDSRLVPTDRHWHATFDRTPLGFQRQIDPLLIEGKYIEDLHENAC